MRWVEIALNVDTATEDAVTDILLSEGCAGTASFTVADRPDNIRICGYLPVDDRLEAKLLLMKERAGRLPEYGLELPDPLISITWVEDDEWANAWKKYFKPLKLGRIIIKPTWEGYQAEGDDIIIELDPGMAFGTGNHETTQLCVLALQDYVERGSSILDAGCGSGILALSAARLGASKVLAFDNDPLAVKATAENVNLAGLEAVVSVMEADSPAACSEKADLVIANIIPNVIINLADELTGATKPGGVLIVSGIVEDRVDDVRNALERLNMEFVEDRRMNIWSALVLRKKS